MKAWLLASTVALAASPAFGDDQNVKFGGRIGTLGYGVEGGFQLHKRINVRASLSGAEINFNETIEGIDYKVTATTGASGAQIDLFPAFFGIYITGGLYSNDNSIELSATPEQGIQIGGTTYTPEQVGRLDGTVTFEDVAPYAGLGWTGKLPFTMIETFFEGGAYFQGAGEIEYVASGLLSEDPGFMADLDAEAAEIQEELSKYEVYPAINIGMRISF